MSSRKVKKSDIGPQKKCPKMAKNGIFGFFDVISVVDIFIGNVVSISGPIVSDWWKKGSKRGPKWHFQRVLFRTCFFSFVKFRPKSLRDFQKRKKMTFFGPKKCPHPPKTGPKRVKKGSFLDQKNSVEALFWTRLDRRLLLRPKFPKMAKNGQKWPFFNPPFWSWVIFVP